jgi:SurA-like N-terminal domain
MNARTKMLLIVVTAAAVLGLLTGAAYAFHLGPWEEEPARDLGPVIARVDGSPIYLGLAQARVEGLTSVHGDLAATLGDDWQTQILDSLIEDQLIQEEASHRGIVVTDDELATHVDKLRGMFESEEQFTSWMQQQSIDLPELERRIRLQTIAAEVYDAVTRDVRVDADAIHDYYRRHRDDYRQADGTVTPLFDVRGEIQQDLLKQQRDAAFAAWLQTRREAATITVVDDQWWRELT